MPYVWGLTRQGYRVNNAELAFARSVDQKGKTWLYQPRQFRLPSGKSYRPDFFVIEDCCFYEVIGTRQAYSYQREKIAEFRAAFPRLRLEVVNLGAWSDGPRGPRVQTVKRPPGSGRRAQTRLFEKLQLSGGKYARLANVMQAAQCRTISDLVRLTGINRDRVDYLTLKTLGDIEAAVALLAVPA